MKITKNDTGTYNLQAFGVSAVNVSRLFLWDTLVNYFKNGHYDVAKSLYKAMDRESRVMLLESLALAEYNPVLTEDQLSSLFEVLID